MEEPQNHSLFFLSFFFFCDDSSSSSNSSIPQPTASTLDMTELKSNPSGGPSTFDTSNYQQNINASPTQGPSAPFPSIPSTIPSTLSTLPMTEPLSASRQARSSMSTAPTIRQADSDWETSLIVQQTPDIADEETQLIDDSAIREDIEEIEEEVVRETQPETTSSGLPRTPIDEIEDNDENDEYSPLMGGSAVAPIPQLLSPQLMYHITSQYVPSTQPDDVLFKDDDDYDGEIDNGYLATSQVSKTAAGVAEPSSKPPEDLDPTTAGDSQVRQLGSSEGSQTVSSVSSGNKQGSQEEASQSPTRARGRRRGSGLVIAEEEEGEEEEKGGEQESEMAQTSMTAPAEEEPVGVAVVKGQIEPAAVTEKEVVSGEEEQVTVSEPSAKAKGKRKETVKVAKGGRKGKGREQEETAVEVESEDEGVVKESQTEESHTKVGLTKVPAATETEAEVSAKETAAGSRKQTKIKAGERQVVPEASTKIPMKKRAMKLQKDLSEEKAAEKTREDEKAVEHETGPPEEEETDGGEETPTTVPLISKKANKAAAPPRGESRSQKGKGKEKEAEKISESAGSSEGEKTDEGEKTPTPASSTRKRSGKSAPPRKHETSTRKRPGMSAPPRRHETVSQKKRGNPKETGSGDEEDETQKMQEEEPLTTEVPVPKKGGRGASKMTKTAGKPRKIKASEVIEEGVVEPEAVVTEDKDAAVEEQVEAEKQAESVEKQAKAIGEQVEVVEELEAAEVGPSRPKTRSEKELSVKAGGHPIKKVIQRKVRRIIEEEDEGSENEVARLETDTGGEADLETENEAVVEVPKSRRLLTRRDLEVPRDEEKRVADAVAVAEDEEVKDEGAASKPAEVLANVQGEEAGIEEADPSRLVTRTAPKKTKLRKGTKPTEIETGETEPAETEPVESKADESSDGDDTKDEGKKGAKKAVKGKGKRAVAASKTKAKVARAKKQHAVDEREKDEGEVAGTDGDTEGGEDEESDVPEIVGSKGKRGSKKAAKGEKSVKGKKPQPIATSEDKPPKSAQAEASGVSLRRSTRTLAKPPPSTKPITKSKGTATRRAKKTVIASEDEQESDELANPPPMITPKPVTKSSTPPVNDEEPFKQFYAKSPKVKVTYKSPGKRRTIAPLPQVSSSSGRAVESSQGSERLSEGSEESEPTPQPKKNKGKQKETGAKKQDNGEGDKAVGRKRKESPVAGSSRSKREKSAVTSDEDEEKNKETAHKPAARGVNKGRSISAKEKGKDKADVKRKQVETEVEEETAESDKQKAGPSTRRSTNKPLQKPAKR